MFKTHLVKLPAVTIPISSVTILTETELLMSINCRGELF